MTVKVKTDLSNWLEIKKGFETQVTVSKDIIAAARELQELIEKENAPPERRAELIRLRDKLLESAKKLAVSTSTVVSGTSALILPSHSKSGS